MLYKIFMKIVQILKKVPLVSSEVLVHSENIESPTFNNILTTSNILQSYLVMDLPLSSICRHNGFCYDNITGSHVTFSHTFFPVFFVLTIILVMGI